MLRLSPVVFHTPASFDAITRNRYSPGGRLVRLGSNGPSFGGFRSANRTPSNRSRSPVDHASDRYPSEVWAIDLMSPLTEPACEVHDVCTYCDTSRVRGCAHTADAPHRSPSVARAHRRTNCRDVNRLWPRSIVGSRSEITLMVLAARDHDHCLPGAARHQPKG